MPSTMRNPARLALAILAFGIPEARGAGTIVEVSYPGSDRAGELIFGATYRAWLPEGVGRLRGVIVHQHGCGQGALKGGETAADDLHWQALARKWDCALIGPVYRQEPGKDCRRWCDPRNGSRARFLQALGDLAARSGHSELAEVPWCLWGHSGGGFWASLMMASDPNRVVAVWLRSGTAFGAWEKGEVPRPDLPEAAYRIPTMCNPGAKEKDEPRFRGAWDGAMAMFRAYRAKGAPIGLAPDPRTAHECGDSRTLAIPFFDACLAARLPDPGSGARGLKPVDPARGWLAPALGEQATPAAEYRGDPAGAVWLPDERVARAWQEYVRTGAVGDATPPRAPSGVKAVASPDRGVEVAWDAEADPESGLRQFIIRRDGQEVGRVPDRPAGKFGRPLFQGLSYHDTPDQPLRPMRFVDLGAEPGRTAEYRVVAVNGVGLESEPSPAAPAP